MNLRGLKPNNVTGMAMPTLSMQWVRWGLVLLVVTVGVSSAEAFNDGFQSANKTKSHYFTIYSERGVNVEHLGTRLSIPYRLQCSVRQPVSVYAQESSADEKLGNELDYLCLVVSEILDINSNDFHCIIKVCKNGMQLSHVSRRLFGDSMRTGGFYVLQNNTIYVDAESISIHVLGHELSHAVQNAYFVVPPPVKIQEVLSGYVEYELRKYSNTLGELRKDI